MAFQITGKLEMIGEVMSKPSNNGSQPFLSREFVLDATRFNPETGEPWENHPRFELSSKNVNIIDGFKVGQRVTVDFTLRGAKYADKQTGEMRYFTSINAFKIVAVEQQPMVQQSVPQPTPQVQVQQQQVSNNPEEGGDDLPF